MKLAVVKLGGSVITRKGKPFDVDFGITEALGRALKRALAESCIDRLVVVHGGGSFGHYVVSEHGGLRTVDAFIQTVFFMRELNQTVVEILCLVGIPAVGVDTHAIALSLERGKELELGVVEELVARGVVPVMYGDAVLDSSGGYRVLSGDDISWEVASAMRASKLVFVTTVPGVYVGGRVAKLVSISRDLDRIDRVGSRYVDVTGGMHAKLAKGRGRVHSIGDVYVIGSQPKLLYEALCSEPSVGTRVVE
ncbi:MAG: acetylglutamate kinase [Crenarchaeota archaeon]|nr:acetylglutamate kinase [Thermoproteota archaeon]